MRGCTAVETRDKKWFATPRCRVAIWLSFANLEKVLYSLRISVVAFIETINCLGSSIHLIFLADIIISNAVL